MGLEDNWVGISGQWITTNTWARPENALIQRVVASLTLVADCPYPLPPHATVIKLLSGPFNRTRAQGALAERGWGSASWTSSLWRTRGI